MASALRFARLRPDGSPGGRRAVAARPLAHVMGLVLSLAYLEARVPAVYLPRFTAAGVLDAIEELDVSLFAGVPGMYRLLEEQADDRDLTSVRLWVSAADVMPREMARRFQHRGSSLAIAGRGIAPAFFVEGYGLVEATGPALSGSWARSADAKYRALPVARPRRRRGLRRGGPPEPPA